MGRLDVVQLLLNAGARSEHEVEGRSRYDRAIELADENGHYFMRRVFEDHSKTIEAYLKEKTAS